MQQTAIRSRGKGPLFACLHLLNLHILANAFSVHHKVITHLEKTWIQGLGVATNVHVS